MSLNLPPVGLEHFLFLAGILFSIAVAGIFLNRKNVILLLMCIELMLLSVNFNFVAFSHWLGNLDGQVVAFFVMVVAASEVVVGLAIIVTIRIMMVPFALRRGADHR